MKKLFTVLAIFTMFLASAQTEIQNDTLKFRFNTDGEYDVIKMSVDHSKGINYSLLKKNALKDKKDAETLINIAVDVKKTEESNPMLYINKILKEGKDKYTFIEIGTSANCCFAEYIDLNTLEKFMVLSAIKDGKLYVFEVKASANELSPDQIVLDFSQIRRSFGFISNSSTE